MTRLVDQLMTCGDTIQLNSLRKPDKTAQTFFYKHYFNQNFKHYFLQKQYSNIQYKVI